MNWFFYFLKRSISQRKSRFVIASSAVMLTVSVLTALVTVSIGMREKIGAELRQYGANMIVTDSRGGYLSEKIVKEISGISKHIKDTTAHIYAMADIDGKRYEIIGLDPSKFRGARVDGRLPEGTREVMVGVNIKGLLNIKIGDKLHFDNAEQEYTVTAFFEKGSDEDSAIVMPLDAARQLFGLKGVSALLLNVDTRYIEEVRKEIKKQYPSVSVKTVRQVAVAEEQLLKKVELLMILVTLVVLFSSVITLGSTMGANVIERMEEIGLMKALGATRAKVRDFFLYESVMAGLVGGAVGIIAGVVVAEGVSRSAFGSFVPVTVAIFPLLILTGVFIAVAATYFPVRDAMRAVPSQILRGE